MVAGKPGQGKRVARPKTAAGDAAEPVERSEAFEAKRLDILRRAAIAFAEDGYHETSVSSLAQRLGVSKPVLYYYAANKDDLVYQICLIAQDELKQAMSSAVDAHLSGLGKIRRFFATYAKIMGSDFGRYYALVDVRVLGEEARAKEIKARREVEDSVRQMLVEGQADGSIRRCDPTLTARALFGAFNGIPRWFHSDGSADIGEIADMYLDVFMLGIARA
jgi:AcrR family transcriptional regulator